MKSWQTHHNDRTVSIKLASDIVTEPMHVNDLIPHNSAVIPEPKNGTASILAIKAPFEDSDTPFAAIKGYGDTDYICGGCRAILASKVDRGHLRNLVLKCFKCNSFNIVSGT